MPLLGMKSIPEQVKFLIQNLLINFLYATNQTLLGKLKAGALQTDNAIHINFTFLLYSLIKLVGEIWD
jgi:hypothetical protein